MPFGVGSGDLYMKLVAVLITPLLSKRPALPGLAFSVPDDQAVRPFYAMRITTGNCRGRG